MNTTTSEPSIFENAVKHLMRGVIKAYLQSEDKDIENVVNLYYQEIVVRSTKLSLNNCETVLPQQNSEEKKEKKQRKQVMAYGENACRAKVKGGDGQCKRRHKEGILLCGIHEKNSDSIELVDENNMRRQEIPVGTSDPTPETNSVSKKGKRKIYTDNEQISSKKSKFEAMVSENSQMPNSMDNEIRPISTIHMIDIDGKRYPVDIEDRIVYEVTEDGEYKEIGGYDEESNSIIYNYDFDLKELIS